MSTESPVLAPLRRDLDFMPSPVEAQPGLVIRDSFQYSDSILIIPPPLVAILDMFDGQTREVDLYEEIWRSTGDIQAAGVVRHMKETLSNAGFLEDENYFARRDAKHREFAEAEIREPAHSGSGYPDELPALEATFERYFAGSSRSLSGNIRGIAAPHVSPEGGWESYREAYSALPPGLAHRTFVILGTSHYGAPNRFGLTRKGFRTPLGVTRTDTNAVDWLRKEAGEAVELEDYCHAVEHSIEFQALFLQRMYGPDVKVVPVLCGSFADAIYLDNPGLPEDHEGVRRFFGALGDWAAREPEPPIWVLGVDMAHMGVRYGDRFAALANEAEMADVARRDQSRLQSIAAGDARGFWEQVQENRDDLKWCGSSPLYTFLKVQPNTQGELLRYEQWNIDDRSVVSFGAMKFT